MPPDSAFKSNSEERRRLFKHWILAIIAIWGISTILLAVGGIYTIIRAQQVTRDLCVVANDNRKLFRRVINVARTQALEDSHDILERNVIRQRYDVLLAVVPPPLKCTTGGPRELKR